jgi:hypothetical protein
MQRTWEDMRRIFATDKKPAGERKEKMTICDPLATMRDSNLNHHWYPPPSIYLIFFIFLKCLVCLSYTPTTFQTSVSCKKRHFLCFLWPTAVWNVVGRLDKQVWYRLIFSSNGYSIHFLALLSLVLEILCWAVNETTRAAWQFSLWKVLWLHCKRCQTWPSSIL